MKNIKALRYAIDCKNIVEQELNIDFKDVSRHRANSYARIIYSHLINKKYTIQDVGTWKKKGLKQDHVAKVVGKNRSTVTYYLNRFEDLINYDDFKEMYDSVIRVWNAKYSYVKHYSSGHFWLKVGDLC